MLVKPYNTQIPCHETGDTGFENIKYPFYLSLFPPLADAQKSS